MSELRAGGGTTRRRFVGLVAAVALLAACGGGGGGDDGGVEIASAIESAAAVGERSTQQALGLQPGDGDVVWKASGTPAQVADSIALVGRPDERTDDANGDVLMLYQAGTVWLTPLAAGGTGVVLYRSNDTAYARHNTMLLRHSSWGSTVNRYRTGGGSINGGNDFRSGGSSSGK